MAAELLAAEADVSLSFTTDQVKGEWVFVRFTRSSLIATVNLVATPRTGDPVETLLPDPLPSTGRIFVPAGWTIHFAFEAFTSGAVRVEILPVASLPAAPAAMWQNADMAGGATAYADLVAAVEAVITDLGADVAGNSVAQAITDLETAIGA